MFVPPSFEPTNPREPQWFPRPITESIESSLDLIERLEEDRKRRLRNIANVPARTPIGLGGVEDRGHAGGSASGGHQSPKPPNSNMISGGCNDYARYRYYPPLVALPSSSSLAAVLVDTPSDLAALHESYTRGSTDSQQQPIPSSSVITRNRIYRRGATPRSASVASTTTTTTNNARLVGGTNDDDEEDEEDESVSMNIDESETAPHHRYMQPSSIQSYYSSPSSVQFTSPPLDPRAGGGGGRRIIHASSSSTAATSTARRQSHPHPHHTLHSNHEEAELNTNSDNGLLTSTEWITPPVITGALQTPNEQHGPGGSRDVYSQRRDTSQRRRRRWWDEVNDN